MNSPSRDLIQHGVLLPAREGVSQASELAAPFQRRLGPEDLYRIFLRHKLLIIGTVLAALAVALVVLARTTPIYSATTTVRVQLEPALGEESDRASAAAGAAQDELRIASKVELLQSRSLARRVVRQLGLQQDPEYAHSASEPGLLGRLSSTILGRRPAPSPFRDEVDPQEAAQEAELERLTDELRDNVTVERIGKSNLIAVTARSADPLKASVIANKLVTEHIDSTRDGQRDSYEREVERLTDRVALARTDMAQADQALASFRRANGIVLSRPEGLSQSQLAQVTGALSQARAEAAARSARSQLFTGSGGVAASSPLLTDLRSQESVLENKLAELTTTFGRRHPEVLAVNAQLAKLRQEISIEVGRVGTGLRQDATVSGAQAGQFASDLGAVQSQGVRNVNAMPMLMALEREVETTSLAYMALAGRLRELSGRGANTSSDVSVVSRAPVPLEPAYPMPKRTLSVALLASLGLGLVLALMVEARDKRVRTSEQVSQWLAVQPLAMLPEATNFSGSPLHELIRLQPRSAFAEAVGGLLVEVDLLAPVNGSHVIMLTSPAGGEGKASVATCLAMAAACAGRSVVVVDFDLRAPRIQQKVAPEQAPADIVDYLVGTAPLASTIAYNPANVPFATIGGFKPIPNAGSIISLSRVANLFTELRKQFDMIIVNTPPVLPVRDAKIIARHADTKLMVLHWGTTDLESAGAAVDLLGGDIDGAILNRISLRRRWAGDPLHDHVAAAPYYGKGEADALPGAKPRLPFLHRGQRSDVES